MSINKSIIDAGPTVSRSEAKIVVGGIVPVAPPGRYVKNTDGGLVVVVAQEPTREGQFVLVQVPGELSVTMYIVVLVLGVPTWKRVYSAGFIVDPRTGKAKDPLFGLY